MDSMGLLSSACLRSLPAQDPVEWDDLGVWGSPSVWGALSKALNRAAFSAPWKTAGFPTGLV